MRALKSYGLALILILGLAGWFLTGSLVQGGKGPDEGEKSVVEAIEGKDGGPLTDAVKASGLAVEHEAEEGAADPSLSIAERNAAQASEDGPARSVRTKTYTLQPMPLKANLRGTIAARATVSAVAKTTDTILAVSVKEGQAVAANDLICTLANGTREAGVNQAKAAVAQADAALSKAITDRKLNESLRAKDLVSANSAEGFATAVSAAEANVEAARAALDNAMAELANTEIRATVPGVIMRPLAEAGDTLAMGQSCATIVRLDPMVFVGAIPQSRIDLAKLGLPVEITTINGAKADGKVTYIAVSADAATRSFAVEAEFANPDGKIRDGLTAEAIVDLGTIPAHLLPQSIMTLDSDGKLGVQTVDDGTVVFREITILQDTREGVWVTGLPLNTDVIVLGQEYVVAGQKVDATNQE
jgi:multidrug efflux system membrane fusion protein